MVNLEAYEVFSNHGILSGIVSVTCVVNKRVYAASDCTFIFTFHVKIKLLARHKPWANPLLNTAQCSCW